MPGSKHSAGTGCRTDCVVTRKRSASGRSRILPVSGICRLILRCLRQAHRPGEFSVVLESGFPHDQLTLVQELVERITIKDGTVAVAIRRDCSVARLGTEAMIGESSPVSADEVIQITLPISLRRRGFEMKLVLSDRTDERAECNVDPGLVKLISQAQDWFERMKHEEWQGSEARRHCSTRWRRSNRCLASAAAGLPRARYRWRDFRGTSAK